jgi:flagellar secretion chaperone FliS
MMMMTDARAAYMDASVATADPSRLLVMLCDRLVLDVQRALAAQLAGNHEEAHHQLVHAQAIVTELRNSLDPEGFRGGAELAALYDYLYRQLVLANIRRDTEVTEECQHIVTQVAQTWRDAALALARTAVPA